MTCIAGVAANNHVYIGGDSAGFDGHVVHKSASGKVFRAGEFIFGCAGSRRFNDLVRYALKLPELPANTDMDAFMAIEFTAALRTALREGGHLNVEDQASESCQGVMLAGVRGKLFLIDSEFAAVRPLGGVCAVGTGAQVALGALHVTGEVAPEKRVLAALEASERWTDSVRAPFVVESI